MRYSGDNSEESIKKEKQDLLEESSRIKCSSTKLPVSLIVENIENDIRRTHISIHTERNNRHLKDSKGTKKDIPGPIMQCDTIRNVANLPVEKKPVIIPAQLPDTEKNKPLNEMYNFSTIHDSGLKDHLNFYVGKSNFVGRPPPILSPLLKKTLDNTIITEKPDLKPLQEVSCSVDTPKSPALTTVSADNEGTNKSSNYPARSAFGEKPVSTSTATIGATSIGSAVGVFYLFKQVDESGRPFSSVFPGDEIEAAQTDFKKTKACKTSNCIKYPKTQIFKDLEAKGRYDISNTINPSQLSEKGDIDRHLLLKNNNSDTAKKSQCPITEVHCTSHNRFESTPTIKKSKLLNYSKTRPSSAPAKNNESASLGILSVYRSPSDGSLNRNIEDYDEKKDELVNHMKSDYCTEVSPKENVNPCYHGLSPDDSFLSDCNENRSQDPSLFEKELNSRIDSGVLNLSQGSLNYISELYSGIIPTEPLNLSPIRQKPNQQTYEAKVEPNRRIVKYGKNTTSHESNLSRHAYKPGTSDLDSNDWCSIVPHNKDIESNNEVNIIKNHTNHCNENSLPSNVKVQIGTPAESYQEGSNRTRHVSVNDVPELTEPEFYYKYRHESCDAIKKTHKMVKQRMNKKGIKRRQRIFYDKHDLDYENMKPSVSYKTPTFTPSNVNQCLEKFIPTIVKQRKQTTAKRMKQRIDTLEDYYKVPKPGKLKFGETEIITFDQDTVIGSSDNEVTNNNKKSTKSILKTTKKESPVEWEKFIGDDTIRIILARIFNICNIPLHLLDNDLETILQKISAAIIIESGNKELCNTYQSLYDEVKFEEHIKITKNRMKDLRKCLEESWKEKRDITECFTKRLEELETNMLTQKIKYEMLFDRQKKDFENSILKEREEFERRTTEDFEDFESVLEEEKNIYNDALAKMRTEFEEQLNGERATFVERLEQERLTCKTVVEEERHTQSELILNIRRQYEGSLSKEQEKVVKIEKNHNILFNSAVEECKIREQIALDNARYMEAEIKRKCTEIGSAQEEINLLTKDNSNLRQIITEQNRFIMFFKPELGSPRCGSSKGSQWKGHYRNKYIHIREKLRLNKKEIKSLNYKYQQILKNNIELKNLVSNLQTNITEAKETIEECKDFVETTQSQIRNCKRSILNMDKKYKTLQENFSTIANAHFPLQEEFTRISTNYHSLQKKYQNINEENERHKHYINIIMDDLAEGKEIIKQTKDVTKGSSSNILEKKEILENLLPTRLEHLKKRKYTPTSANGELLAKSVNISLPTERTELLSGSEKTISREQHSPTTEYFEEFTSKRGSKRKILRSLANKMSLTHHNCNRNVHVGA